MQFNVRGYRVFTPKVFASLQALLWSALLITSSPARSQVGFRPDLWSLPGDALLGFVEIPAGQFQMGSNPLIDPLAFENERWSEAQRQGSPDIPAFYMGRYEVTIAQFKAFAEEANYRVDPQALTGSPDNPVAFVSWTDALAYTRWLNTVLQASDNTPLELTQLLRNGWHISLPDEAQWEKAARGTDGRIYPWGNQPRKDRANYGSTSVVAVGSFRCPECPYGLKDMSGNVWEWTRSPYQPLPFNTDDDRESLPEDALWIMRGGAFSDDANNIRAAVRGGADPGARREFIGFRVAITR